MKLKKPRQGPNQLYVSICPPGYIKSRDSQLFHWANSPVLSITGRRFIRFRPGPVKCVRIDHERWRRRRRQVESAIVEDDDEPNSRSDNPIAITRRPTYTTVASRKPTRGADKHGRRRLSSATLDLLANPRHRRRMVNVGLRNEQECNNFSRLIRNRQTAHDRFIQNRRRLKAEVETRRFGSADTVFIASDDEREYIRKGRRNADDKDDDSRSDGENDESGDDDEDGYDKRPTKNLYEIFVQADKGDSSGREYQMAAKAKKTKWNPWLSVDRLKMDRGEVFCPDVFSFNSFATAVWTISTTDEREAEKRRRQTSDDRSDYDFSLPQPKYGPWVDIVDFFVKDRRANVDRFTEPLVNEANTVSSLAPVRSRSDSGERTPSVASDLPEPPTPTLDDYDPDPDEPIQSDIW